ncbi:hypothetical protein ACJJTC_008736 [Scirpophaga incertulas]
MFRFLVLWSITVIVGNCQIASQENNVTIQVYYESQCGGCRDFFRTSLLYVYRELHDSFEIQTYPYGFAETIINSDGAVEFKCQHGPNECYGNMLHACAIDILGNFTKALDFNACMMEQGNPGKGSNDPSAEKCADLQNIKSQTIKDCAKSQKGADLVKRYGEKSNKITYEYIPYVIINGEVWNQESNPDFMVAVCGVYNIPPAPCVKYLAEINGGLK